MSDGLIRIRGARQHNLKNLDLDLRTAELTVGILRLTNSGTRTLSTIDKAAKNFDANPSRLIWGGPPPEPKPKEPRASAPRGR